MLAAVTAILVGFALLVWGADRFIVGAASLARQFGAPPLLIGLTLVGLGTSAPEMVVAAVASLGGNPGLAMGNAVGSNITNIALILGTTALIMPLSVKSGVLKRELPVVALISVAAFVLVLDGQLTRGDGAVLVTGLVMLLVWLAWLARSGEPDDVLGDEFDEGLETDLSTGRAVGWLIVGMILLPVSSRLAVWGAVEIATAFGVSDLVIGLTIVAIGTSLPELAASISAAFKGEPDMALGNVLGSNMFNLLIVLAMPALIAPGLVPGALVQRDMPFMLVLTAVLFVLCYPFRGRGVISRVEACILLTAFIGYQLILYSGSMS